MRRRINQLVGVLQSAIAARREVQNEPFPAMLTSVLEAIAGTSAEAADDDDDDWAVEA